MLGPQWLCGCNESGGADTVEGAGGQAAQHFLYHHDRGDAEAVSVYKERNEWLYTISTMEGATEAIKRENEAVTAPTAARVQGTFTHTLRRATESLQKFADTLGQHVQEPAAPGPSASREERRRFEQGVDTLMPLPRPVRPMRGVDIGNMPFQEANNVFRQMVDEQLRESMSRWNATHGR